MILPDQVYRLVQQIPPGKVSTYQAVAHALHTNACRFIGKILRQSPGMRQNIPCHRVIRSDGSLGGFNRGLARKICLLEQEGILIKKQKVDLKKYLCSFERR